MTVGSLFAGIGGFDLGLERAGMTVKWQVEIDPFCRAVLAKHWPHVRRYEDVRTVSKRDLEPVDLLCGGFPCQDISDAGKRTGINGARSGLWSEFARLISELRPRYVVVENVSALLARGFGRVLGDLAACGYDAEWDCLPASAFGAPHRRDRVWIIAHQRDSKPTGHGSEGDVDRYHMADAAGLQLRQEPHARADCIGHSRARPVSGQPEARAILADADSQGRLQPEGSQRQERRRFSDSGWWDVEPNVGRVAHGVPARVDRLRGLGNAIVPQIAEWIGRRILDAERADCE